MDRGRQHAEIVRAQRRAERFERAQKQPYRYALLDSAGLLIVVLVAAVVSRQPAMVGVAAGVEILLFLPLRARKYRSGKALEQWRRRRTGF